MELKIDHQNLRNFNPRSSCEERRDLHRCGGQHCISIHAPHARSDRCPSIVCPNRTHISIHAPHARSDYGIWLSTDNRIISIHAPHARSDFLCPLIYRQHGRFQSTLLMRGATLTSATGVDICSYFNPRSSCEERPARRLGDRAIALFQSTLLMRGATRSPSRSALTIRFQSTLLMRGATKQAIYLVTTAGFQSTLLMRGATSFLLSAPASESISIHAPHARSDLQAHHST